MTSPFQIKGIAQPINPSGAYQTLAQMQMAAELSKGGMLDQVKGWVDGRVQHKDQLELIDRQYGLRKEQAQAQNESDMQRDVMKAALKTREEALNQEGMARASEYMTQLTANPKHSPFKKLEGSLKDSLPELADMTEQDIQSMLERRNPAQDPRQISKWTSSYMRPSQQRYADVRELSAVRTEMYKMGFTDDQIESAMLPWKDLPTTQEEARKFQQSRITASAQLWNQQSAVNVNVGQQLAEAVQGIQSREFNAGAAGAGSATAPPIENGATVSEAESGIQSMLLPDDKLPAPDDTGVTPADEVGAGLTPGAAKTAAGTQGQAATMQTLLSDPQAWEPQRLTGSLAKTLLNGRSLSRIMGDMPESAEGVLQADLAKGLGVTLKPQLIRTEGGIKLYGVEAVALGGGVDPKMLKAINTELNSPMGLAGVAGMWAGGGDSYAEIQKLGQGLIHIEVGGRKPQREQAPAVEDNPFEVGGYLGSFAND